MRPVVRIGAPDRSLTGVAGLAVVDELVGALAVVPELDRAVGPIEARERGLTAGQLLVGMARTTWKGSITATASGSSSAVAVLKPVNRPSRRPRRRRARASGGQRAMS